jgi:hypothetical protein
MTKDDIIRMAREAGLHSAVLLHIYEGKEAALTDSEQDELRRIERFAALVEKHAIAASMPAIKLAMAEERKNGAREELEACAQIALQWDKEHPSTNFGGCIARSIRARGEAA